LHSIETCEDGGLKVRLYMVDPPILIHFESVESYYIVMDDIYEDRLEEIRELHKS